MKVHFEQILLLTSLLAIQMYGTADDVPFITWMQAGEKMWTLKEPGVRPNPDTQIGQRLISNEPM